MKRNIDICTVFLIGFLCTGCASGNHEEAVTEQKSASETILQKAQIHWKRKMERLVISAQENFVVIQIFAPEDVKVTPEIVEWDGSPNQVERMGYAIISDKYSLANGISVGMTKTEILVLCPAMAILDTEGNAINEVAGHMGWSGIDYPHSPVQMDGE